jgi:hypothetical protein
MTTALPTQHELTGSGLTRSAFRTSLNALRSYLAGLLDTDGTAESAITKLGAVTATVTFPAGESIGGHRCVSVIDGVAFYTNITNEESASCYVGITESAYNFGDDVIIRAYGAVTEGSWTFTPGSIYVSATATLTQTPPASGAIIFVGTAATATSIILDHSTTVW